MISNEMSQFLGKERASAFSITVGWSAEGDTLLVSYFSVPIPFGSCVIRV